MTVEELLAHPNLSSIDKALIEKWARVNKTRAINYGVALVAFHVLIKEPTLALGQVRQAQMIKEYSVSSAVRYLQLVKVGD